ncbi:MAG: isoprenylcysteine carboxylmethyltransferase family protein, partial [Phycisphaerales bacterium]
GDSLRMGLPEERTTKLKTSGTYRISRNPMYLALNLIMIAAILFTINPVILILAVVAIYTNHRVIVGEEKFLEKEFGSEYIKYCKKVRRYI